MVESPEKHRHDRVYQRLVKHSFKRLKKRGATDDEAGDIARRVAEQSLARVKPPPLRTDEEFASLVAKICTKLGDGMSYYELFGDMPFLATGRVDRIVAVALRTTPPVELSLARAAKRATALERSSSGVALLLFSLALSTIGLWYAIALGLVVCIATEIYVQTLMPASLRKKTAALRAPTVVFAMAVVSLVLLAYRWYAEVTAYPYLLAFAAALAVVVIVFLVPGVVLARLVARRERRWRRRLERSLLDENGYKGS